MSANKTRVVGDKIICTIPPSGTRRSEWTITFSSTLYAFLRDHVGDVHLWADQQRELIEAGTLPFRHPLLVRVLLGERPTSKAIGDVIRAYALVLLGNKLDDL